MLKSSYTRHGFGRSVVLDFNTRVQENTRPHNFTATTDAHFNQTTHQQAWRSDPGDEVTPLGPGRTSTVYGAWFARDAVDGPQPNHRAHAAVSETHLHSRGWRSHSTTTATNTTQVTTRATTREPSRHVQSGDALMVCTSARLTSTSAQKTKWEDSGDAQTIAETVTNHKQYDSEYRCPTQLTVSRPHH